MTVREVYEFIDRIAPFDTQAGFDNAGLLVGHPDREIRGVLFAMDVTGRVLDEAKELGVDLIVTHHPMMFSARKNLVETDYEAVLLCRMIRENLSLIAAHTNLDQANGGINDVLAQVCGLTNVTGEGYYRVGDLPAGTTVTSLTARLAKALHTTVRVMGQQSEDEPLHRMGLCSGAGSEFWQDCQAAGADVFLTGEMKHHHALAMADAGVLGLEAGHFATEEPGIFALADALQNQLNLLQCNVTVYKSQLGAYA